MLVEPQFGSKELGRFLGQQALVCQFFQGQVHLKGRIQLQHRLWPQCASGQHLGDVLVNPRIQYLDETLQVVPVFGNHGILQSKNIQRHGAHLVVQVG